MTILEQAEEYFGRLCRGGFLKEDEKEYIAALKATNPKLFCLIVGGRYFREMSHELERDGDFDKSIDTKEYLREELEAEKYAFDKLYALAFQAPVAADVED